MKKKTYITTTNYELEELIKRNYSLIDFRITELANDTDYTYVVKKDRLIGAVEWFMIESLQQSLKQGYVEEWKLYIILDDMARKGWIEAGKYLMEVSW